MVVKFSPPGISGSFLGQVPFSNPFTRMGFLDRSNSGGGGLSLTTTVSLNIISNISMRTTTPFVSFCNLRTKFYLQWPWIDSFEISFHCVRNFLFNNSAWVNSCFNIDSQAKFTWCVFCSFSPSKFPAFVFCFLLRVLISHENQVI